MLQWLEQVPAMPGSILCIICPPPTSLGSRDSRSTWVTWVPLAPQE